MFAFSRNYRGLRTFLWIALVSIMVTGCDKNEEPTGPQPATEKNRTVLFYMMDDNNLWDVMLNTLNQVEQGWNDDIDGNFLLEFKL